MIITPKDTPVITGLNSFYLNIERLIEHYRGELGSGCVHFISNTNQGVLFFDETELIGGAIENRDGQSSGPQSVERIIDAIQGNNFRVSVYHIGPDIIHFWASLPGATPLYSDLSSEFTDLDRLVAKMQGEKLTGVIEMSMTHSDQGGIICFNAGELIDCTCSWATGPSDSSSVSNLKFLTEKAGKDPGAVFSVKRISLEQKPAASPSDSSASTQNTPDTEAEPVEPTLDMVRDLLLIFQRSLEKHDKKKAVILDKLLRKKFIEKAENYDFLDPFAAEFEFADGAVHYTGPAPLDRVLRGVAESVKELAEEQGMLYDFLLNMAPWKEKFTAELYGRDIGI